MKKHSLSIFGRAFVCAGLSESVAPLARGDVSLPSILGSHMVLQRDVTCPIWGRATAGEEVTVEFAGQKQSAKADVDGNWMIKLAAAQGQPPSRR